MSGTSLSVPWVNDVSDERFVYTSGRRSLRHEHTGYGLKEGLEGAPYELVEHLEGLCVLLCQARRAREGQLVALSAGVVRWTGHVSVTLGYEPSGRPNVRLTGAPPPLELIQESLGQGLSWRFEESGGAIEPLIRAQVRRSGGSPRSRGRRAALCVLIALAAWLIWRAYLSQPKAYLL